MNISYIPSSPPPFLPPRCEYFLWFHFVRLGLPDQVAPPSPLSLLCVLIVLLFLFFSFCGDCWHGRTDRLDRGGVAALLCFASFSHLTD